MKAFFVTLGKVIAVAVLIGVIVCAVCWADKVDSQETIVKVFSEQSKAAAQLRQDINGGNQKPTIPEMRRALRAYANAVQSINASLCPKDFRLAWFDYVSEVSDESDKNLTMSAVGDLLELEMSAWTHDGKLAENALKDADSNQICLDYRRCQRIAVSHGVRFHPVENQQ